MIEPTIYKSKVYKSFIKELSKPPKIIVHPKNKTKEEIRKAGLVQKIINYQFKNNMKKKSFKKLGGFETLAEWGLV